ncbi:MAG TPA: dethiobiotin synthase [Chryseolinea sp.]|nr:dethiobiotin synthase [Chryseolinea sp.]
MNYFVTAIGTDSGKTVVSSILCKALQADYWKPVQAGLPRDSETVLQFIGNGSSKIHPETFFFKTAASPHAAAALENVVINLNDFIIPAHKKDLIIEGAGGCLVPLNDQNFVIDLATKLEAEVILVSNLYLGSINHTMLSYEALVRRKLKIKGIVFNGPSNAESERIILLHTKLPCLLRIDQEAHFDEQTIIKYAKKFLEKWNG